MSINSITKDMIEYFDLQLSPKHTFTSSSLTGPTGTLRVYPRGSKFEKEVAPLSIFSQSFFNDADLSYYLQAIDTAVYSGTTNVQTMLSGYFSAVDAQSPSPRKLATLQVSRFNPSVTFDTTTLKKSTIINNLTKYYRSVYPTAHFAYTNYHSLNFFTASSVPSNSVLMYPNINSASLTYGAYLPTGAFSFDFWINPRYQGEAGAGFKAGTLFHLSSCYAVSLITGSAQDINGYPTGFRIMLQLSHSAEIPPSLAVTGGFPNNLIFLSNDNALKYNNWHHVTVRWGTNGYNFGTGSFIVDGVNQGYFAIPSASVAPPIFANGSPNVLFVGNFYEGTNKSTNFNFTSYFFQSAGSSLRDGVAALYVTNLFIHPPSDEVPNVFTFAHPLNAEVHELKIYNKYLFDTDIKTLGTTGPNNFNNLVFYVPPFFTYESPTRTFVTDHGGILYTPFQQVNGTTTRPFSVEYSYGVGGHYINLENFTKDFAQGVFPRLFNLTASVAASTTVLTDPNTFLYATSGSNIKRNLTILPNDNGLFYPNFNIITSSFLNDTILTTGSLIVSASLERFYNDLNRTTLGLISLRDLLPTSSLYQGFTKPSGSIAAELFGAMPENLSGSSGSLFTVLQRTRDNTSNQVTIFNIPNLYYGNQISENTFIITDNNITGSTGKVSITLQDDGHGNLYRANCLTTQATWNSVGNLFPNEGIALIKSPHLFFFGKDYYTTTFKGKQELHTTIFDLVAKSGQITSSSNPTYQPLSASIQANETNGTNFVYITGINIHDRDQNIIMRCNLAQPILKRASDKIMFKVKMAW